MARKAKVQVSVMMSVRALLPENVAIPLPIELAVEPFAVGWGVKPLERSVETAVVVVHFFSLSAAGVGPPIDAF
jgi:hypothetical protein